MEPNLFCLAATTRLAVAPAPMHANIVTDIRGAWVAACISAALTVVVTLTDHPGSALGELSPWWLPGWWPLDIAITALLAFGTRAGRRTSAAAMLAYFLVSKTILLSQHATAAAILLTLMFTYCLWHGVRGTHAWHHQRTKADQADC